MLLPALADIIKDSKRTLYIMCGLPYSGKTFNAQKLVELTGATYVSIDNLFHADGYDWDTNKLPNKEGWDKIFDVSYQMARDALVADNSVIYDSTNHTKVSRDRLRAVAQEVMADTAVIFVDVSEEVIWLRWEDNKQNPSRSVVAKELVQDTINTFEKPTEEESVYIIQSN